MCVGIEEIMKELDEKKIFAPELIRQESEQVEEIKDVHEEGEVNRPMTHEESDEEGSEEEGEVPKQSEKYYKSKKESFYESRGRKSTKITYKPSKRREYGS